MTGDTYFVTFVVLVKGGWVGKLLEHIQKRNQKMVVTDHKDSLICTVYITAREPQHFR